MKPAMLAQSRRWAVAAGAVALGCAVALTGSAPLALAQSPRPNVSALDQRPSNFNTRPTGIVVEGVGMGRCSYSLSSVESATVRYIRARKPVWTEISPQSGCASLSSYKSMIHSLIRYLEGRVSHAALNWWAGIMLDEEPNFGFSVSSLISLNSYADGLILNVPGGSLVFSEDATWAGAWTQRQYDRIIAHTVPAPQVYNSYMVGIVNRSSPTENLVTWTKTAGFPFNRESYVTGRIRGAPYHYKFGTRHNWAWSNQWQSQ
jgi:hypothetical protein